MSKEGKKLIRAARQLIEGEQLLGGQFMPARRNPLPEPAPLQAAAAPAPRPAGATAGTPGGGASAGTPGGGASAGTGGAPAGELPPVPEEMTPQQKAQALSELEAQCRCDRCVLARGRTNLVFGEGDPDADLVFVGEGPGQEEDRTGRPFVGKAGQLLTKMIQGMGLRREDVYICNVVKCRPPNNRPPLPDEIKACWGYLIRQLQIIRPKVIVTLGNPAMQSLLRTREGVTAIRGQWRKLPDLAPGLEGIPVMPTFHPSYVLRTYTTEIRRMVWDDLQKVMDKLGLKRRGKAPE